MKYHHFWDAVNCEEVQVEKVDTALQNADYLTKGLAPEPYLANRHRVQGWLVHINGEPYIKVHTLGAQS